MKQDESYKISRPYGMYRKSGTVPNVYRSGEFHTPHGIVGIYHDKDYTQFRFCYNGREYFRSIGGKSFTDRGLSIMAGKFVADVIMNRI